MTLRSWLVKEVYLIATTLRDKVRAWLAERHPEKVEAGERRTADLRV